MTSLKKGFPNHSFLSNLPDGQLAKFISNAKTLNRYPLIVATPANIPFLLDAPSKGQQVQGEVYQVCRKTLNALDDLEDEGVLYDRKMIPIVLSDANVNEQQIDVFTYILGNFKASLLELPFLSSFSEEHAKQYRSRQDRDEDQESIRSFVKE